MNLNMDKETEQRLAKKFVSMLTDEQFDALETAINDLRGYFHDISRDDDPDGEWTFDLEHLPLSVLMSAMIDEGESRDIDVVF